MTGLPRRAAEALDGLVGTTVRSHVDLLRAATMWIGQLGESG